MINPSISEPSSSFFGGSTGGCSLVCASGMLTIGCSVSLGCTAGVLSAGGSFSLVCAVAVSLSFCSSDAGFVLSDFSDVCTWDALDSVILSGCLLILTRTVAAKAIKTNAAAAAVILKTGSFFVLEALTASLISSSSIWLIAEKSLLSFIIIPPSINNL